MYGLPCSHCGQKELFHNLAPDIEAYKNNPGLFFGWELLDYGEESDGIDEVGKHKTGYRKHFNNCPCFTYSKKISDATLVKKAVSSPGTIYYIDKKLARRAEKIIAQMEEEKSSQYALTQQHTIYIILDRSGVSRCYAGE